MEENIKIIEDFIRTTIKPIINRLKIEGDYLTTNSLIRNIKLLKKSDAVLDYYTVITYFRIILGLVSRNQILKGYLTEKFIQINKNFIILFNNIIEHRYPNTFEQDKQFFELIAKTNETKIETAKKRLNNYIKDNPLDLYYNFQYWPYMVTYKRSRRINFVLTDFYKTLSKIIKNALH